jgi:hypothetical protein
VQGVIATSQGSKQKVELKVKKIVVVSVYFPPCLAWHLPWCWALVVECVKIIIVNPHLNGLSF